MRPVKNKRRIDPRYFLEETADRIVDEADESEVGVTEGHDDDCDCSKCPKSKKKKKGKKDDGREMLFGEDEQNLEEGDNN